MDGNKERRVLEEIGGTPEEIQELGESGYSGEGKVKAGNSGTQLRLEDR